MSECCGSYGCSGAKGEVIAVDRHADSVKCDGGGGALGHPLVYYSFARSNTVECLYCDRIFVKQA